MGDAFALGSKANDLFENRVTFLIHRATSLEHDWSEVIVGLLKSWGVPLDLLVQGVRFARFGAFKVRNSKRTNHSNVNGETAMETPVLDGDISRSSTGAVSNAQKSQLLHFGCEKANVCELEDEVSQAIVSRNSVTGLLAA